jgi:hypothetical protein
MCFNAVVVYSKLSGFIMEIYEEILNCIFLSKILQTHINFTFYKLLKCV